MYVICVTTVLYLF